MAGLRTSVAAGVGWTAVQKWSLRLASVGTFVVLSRLLRPEEIGLAALAMACLGVIAVLADLGITAFLVQSESWDEETRSTAFWTSTALSVAAAVLLSALATPLSALLGEPRLGPVLLALMPVLVGAGLSAVPMAILQREMRFREISLREMGASLGSALVGICLAVAGAGVWALVAQSLTQSVVGTALVWGMSDWRPTRRVTRTALAELRRFGAPALGVNVLLALRDRMEQFLLGSFLGVAALGYWSVAVRLLALLADVSVGVLDSVVLPVFAKTRNEPQRFRRVFEQALASTQVLLVPVLAVLAVVSPFIVPALFGAEWVPAVLPAQALCLAYAIAGLASFNRPALLAHGRPGVEFLLMTAALAYRIGVVVLVAPHGLAALAWAFSVDSVLTVALGSFALRRTLGVGLSALRRSVTIFAGGALATAGVLAVGPDPATFGGAVVDGILVTALVCAAMWVTNAALLRELAGDANRLIRRRAPTAAPPQPAAPDTPSPAGSATPRAQVAVDARSAAGQ